MSTNLKNGHLNRSFNKKPSRSTALAIAVSLTLIAATATEYAIRKTISRADINSTQKNKKPVALQFIKNLQTVYLSEEAKKNARMGIEVEMNGVSQALVANALIELFGGTLKGEYIEGSSLGGRIRVMRDGAMWQYDDWMRENNDGKESRFKRLYYSAKDALQSSVEVVFPPLGYEGLVDLEKAMAAFKRLGAKSTSGFSCTAIHPNLQVEVGNTTFNRNLIGNYSRNKDLFRAYFNPSRPRRRSPFIPDFQESLNSKLADYNYQPNAEEFWVDFKEGSHIKFSRINIGPVMLSDMSVGAEEKQRMIDEGWTNPRPAIEFREPETSFEPGYITDLVNTGIAVIEASKVTGFINPKDLEIQAEKVKLVKQAKLAREHDFFKRPFEHSLTETISGENYVTIQTKKLNGAQVSYLDEAFLKQLKLVNPNVDIETLKAKFKERFAFEVVRPNEKADGSYTEKVLSLAYDDGYLGIGDGRANWLFEVPVPGKGTWDFGSKGGGLTAYGIPQASIDAGFHIAEKDGYLSLEEAMLTLQDTHMLRALGIESEQIVGIIETGKMTGYNLSPPKPTKAAIVIRAFENGLRGAHLQKYSTEELKSVSLWLREREAIRLGRNPKDLPPLETYIQNKITRDAKRAATAQHFWLLHGAINVANITENGWADLNYVEAMRIPDGNYTSLNIYSRLNYQAKEFLRVSTQFVNKIASVDPSLKVDVKGTYWKTYNEELSRLELVSAGVSAKTAAEIVKKDPALAREYMNAIWDVNYNHLRTNSKELKAEMPSVVLKQTSTGSSYASGIAQPDYEKLVQKTDRIGDIKPEKLLYEELLTKYERVYQKTRQAVISALGLEGDKTRSITRAKASVLATLTMQIAQVASTIEGKSVDATLMEMTTNAKRIAKVELPTRAELEKVFEQYEKSGSKNINEFIKQTTERFTGLKRTLDLAYDREDARSGGADVLGIYGEKPASEKVVTLEKADQKKIEQKTETKKAEEKAIEKKTVVQEKIGQRSNVESLIKQRAKKAQEELLRRQHDRMSKQKEMRSRYVR